MPLFILGLILTVAVVLLLRAFLLAEPRLLARCLRWAAALVAVALTLLLLESGREGLLLTLAVLAAPLVFRGGWRRRFGGGAAGGRAAPGRTSQVETRLLHMTLDHDTGVLSGVVVSGRFAGRELDQLEFSEVMALLEDCRQMDGPSVSVLEAWLDRNHGTDWRSRSGTAGQAETGGTMTKAEALAVLGLASGAAPEAIREAHRRLMAKIHPDHGGSTWLAAKLNQARDLLLNS